MLRLGVSHGKYDMSAEMKRKGNSRLIIRKVFIPVVLHSPASEEYQQNQKTDSEKILWKDTISQEQKEGSRCSLSLLHFQLLR